MADCVKVCELTSKLNEWTVNNMYFNESIMS